jgi:hypothetical protein
MTLPQRAITRNEPVNLAKPHQMTADFCTLDGRSPVVGL